MEFFFKVTKVFFIVLVLVSSSIKDSLAIRVCRTFKDYSILDSPNCYDNPDGESDSSEMISRWGFQSEKHYIQTEDGYILLINRAYIGNSVGKVPIVLGHGISSNSNIFTDRGNKSLAYTLGKQGFDVWILNFRGSKYSLGHVNRKSNDRAYWNFSFHEIAIYDLRSSLNYVYQKTHQKSIYVGFSMGTTTGFIYSSMYPQEAKELLIGFVALAPVAYMRNLEPVVQIGLKFYPLIMPLLRKLTNGSIGKSLAVLSSQFCTKNKLEMFICEGLKGFIFGWDYSQLDPLDLPVINTINYDLIGLKVLSHYSQFVNDGRFSMYNYGIAGNQKLYGTITPPEYNLERIQVPVIFLVGKNDRLATEKGAKLTYQHLHPYSRCGFNYVTNKHFVHNNFPESRNVVPLVNIPVVQFILNLLNNNYTCSDRMQ